MVAMVPKTAYDTHFATMHLQLSVCYLFDTYLQVYSVFVCTVLELSIHNIAYNFVHIYSPCIYLHFTVYLIRIELMSEVDGDDYYNTL